MPLQEGQMVGPYQVIAQLGQGGMASVYKAYHAKLDRHVAIKVMHQAFQEDPTFNARFEREAQIVAKLEHANIVPVYDYAEFEGQAYLVMKFVEGRTLKNLLSAGPPPVERVVSIMTAIADALEYAHRRGVLHRDIKPSNIVIDKDGTPYLTDFGLARIAQAGESTMSQDMILGTPQYISPEQARGERNLDARTDIYSFGVILYEMVVGRVPFNADTPYAIVHDHIYSPLPMPRSLNPAAPPAVERVLVKALAKNPAERYSSAGELMTDFRAAVQTAGLQANDLNAGYAPLPNAVVTPAMPRIPTPPPIPSHDDNSPTITEDLPRPATPGKKGKYVTIPSPMAGSGSSSRRRGMVERQFDAGRIDWGNLGQQMERGIRRSVEVVTDIASQVQESVQNSQKQGLSEEERIRRRIEKRYKERGAFLTHFAIYVVINALLWGIWAFAQPSMLPSVQALGGLPPEAIEGMMLPWPLIVTLAWGIGVLSHFISYYNKYGPGADRREQAIEREIERQRARRGDSGAQVVYEEKPKRRVRLSDDGELEEVTEDDDLYAEAKRKRGSRR